jgi:hypothetical protein
MLQSFSDCSLRVTGKPRQKSQEREKVAENRRGQKVWEGEGEEKGEGEGEGEGND